MNAMRKCGLGARTAVALWGLLFVAGSAWSANTPIYKCFDRNLGLLYTDLPCKDGEMLDLRPGDADPASVARLERQRDQLDQSAAQRIIDERRAAAQREFAYGMRDETIYDRVAPDYSDSSLSYGYPLLAYPPPRAHPRPHRPRPPQIADQHRFAPNPPYIVPRQ